MNRIENLLKQLFTDEECVQTMDMDIENKLKGWYNKRQIKAIKKRYKKRV